MIYEFIATITAGFACAGIALVIRHLIKLLLKRTPKWLTPLFAAIGIFAFQIHQEYHWFTQTKESLPSEVMVVKSITQQSWYRPWSYVKPQVIRFMAVRDMATLKSITAASTSTSSSTSTSVNTSTQLPTEPTTVMNTDNIHLVYLYLFERRMSTKIIPQLVDCAANKHADIATDVFNQLVKDPTLTPEVLRMLHMPTETNANLEQGEKDRSGKERNRKDRKVETPIQWMDLQEGDGLLEVVCS